MGAMQILTDVFAIAVMYSAAAFGWLLFIAIPPIVASVLSVLAQHRVVHLRARQKKILEEWSKAVAEDVKNPAVLKEQKASASGNSAAESASVDTEAAMAGAASTQTPA
jgi:membrane glycosyltransferase